MMTWRIITVATFKSTGQVILCLIAISQLSKMDAICKAVVRLWTSIVSIEASVEATRWSRVSMQYICLAIAWSSPQDPQLLGPLGRLELLWWVLKSHCPWKQLQKFLIDSLLKLISLTYFSMWLQRKRYKNDTLIFVSVIDHFQCCQETWQFWWQSQSKQPKSVGNMQYVCWLFCITVFCREGHHSQELHNPVRPQGWKLVIIFHEWTSTVSTDIVFIIGSFTNGFIPVIYNLISDQNIVLVVCDEFLFMEWKILIDETRYNKNFKMPSNMKQLVKTFGTTLIDGVQKCTFAWGYCACQKLQCLIGQSIGGEEGD